MRQQLVQIQSEKEALRIVGGLSRPSKIPCFCYNLPAEACITGAKLVCVEGTTCNGCYALRGWYAGKKGSAWNRMKCIKDSRWVQAMIYLIQYHNQAYFRWHDSGDIQGTWHLKNICDVAEQTPETKHWLPTREYEIVKKFRLGLGLGFPKNLIVRLSAHMVEGSPPLELARELGVQVSGVSETNFTCMAHTKMAPTNNGRYKEWRGYCGSCRDCWNPEIFSVVYKLHLAKNKLTPMQTLRRVEL